MNRDGNFRPKRPRRETMLVAVAMLAALLGVLVPSLWAAPPCPAGRGGCAQAALMSALQAPSGCDAVR
jgi:hypothetical protein